MKNKLLKYSLLFSFVSLSISCEVVNAVEKVAPKFKNDEDKISYIIGHQISSGILNEDFKVNKAILIKSLDDGLSGKTSELSPQESQAFMQKYLTAQSTKKGAAYLAKVKKEPGVVTLPSGLMYKILESGTGNGEKPKATDTVTVHYEGTLVNGKIFDSSYQRNKPVSFPVNGVIKGWTEALQLMPVGSTWMLYIPSNLAYGEQSPSPMIPPNSTLVFKVNLISIAKPAPATPAK